MTEKRVKEILDSGKINGVIVDGEEIYADLVVVSTEVKPETELAQKLDIKLGKTGGIKMNELMETNVEDIYATGTV